MLQHYNKDEINDCAGKHSFRFRVKMQSREDYSNPLHMIRHINNDWHLQYYNTVSNIKKHKFRYVPSFVFEI